MPETATAYLAWSRQRDSGIGCSSGGGGGGAEAGRPGAGAALLIRGIESEPSADACAAVSLSLPHLLLLCFFPARLRRACCTVVISDEERGGKKAEVCVCVCVLTSKDWRKQL